MQYKLIHGFIATNQMLYKMNILDSPRCNFCNLYKQDLIHMFYDCIETKNFWFDVNEWLVKYCNARIQLSLQNIILGDLTTSDFLNRIILFAKSFICKNKYNDTIPSVHLCQLVEKIYGYQQ